MKLKPPVNENYAGVVVRVRSIVTLPGLDNLVGVPVLGYQALTTKDVQVGELMVVFTAETQLSYEFAWDNNLHRHADRNSDPDAKGYLEDNRRVRAIKLRGHRSDALLLSLDSLDYTGIDLSELKEGDTFDELDGHPICQKFVVKQPRVPGQGNVNRPVIRVSERNFPLHFDTSNYFRNVDLIQPDDEVVVTQKLHGTSVRIGHVPVQRKLSRAERFVKWLDGKLGGRLNVKVQETEYAYVYGSRRVVKDPDNPFDTGFYGYDVYSEIGSQLKGSLPKGYVVYGEIIGYAGHKVIQPGYSYGLWPEQSMLYVYRVTHVTPDGRQVDLTWDQVKAFCDSIDVNYVPELGRVTRDHPLGLGDLNADWPTLYLDRRFADTYPEAVPTEEGTVDEGVCLRVDGGRLTPLVLKAKSPVFLQYETARLDMGEADIEEAQEDPDAEVWRALDGDGELVNA